MNQALRLSEAIGHNDDKWVMKEFARVGFGINYLKMGSYKTGAYYPVF